MEDDRPDRAAPRVALEPESSVSDGHGGSERGTSPSAVLTADELAKLLRVDRKTVYAALNAGEIPGARRIGRTIRISRDVVLRWLADDQDRVPRSRRK